MCRTQTLELEPAPESKLLQAAEAALGASAAPLSAWDVPDSLRLGHELVVGVALRRALCGTPLSAQLTFARDGSIRIQVGMVSSLAPSLKGLSLISPQL